MKVEKSGFYRLDAHTEDEIGLAYVYSNLETYNELRFVPGANFIQFGGYMKNDSRLTEKWDVDLAPPERINKYSRLFVRGVFEADTLRIKGHDIW